MPKACASLFCTGVEWGKYCFACCYYLEITTYIPALKSNPGENSFNILCDNSGNIIGVRKQNWQLYDYNYDMVLYEERYNVLTFIGGNCGMLYAR
jgi:hypothetical protein